MILDILDAIAACLDREAARKLVRLNVDEATIRRAAELQCKERQSQLTRDEQAELLLCVSVQQFLAHLQLKARGILRRPRGSTSA